MFGIVSSNSLPDYAMFGRPEDGSWFLLTHSQTMPCLAVQKMVAVLCGRCIRSRYHRGDGSSFALVRQGNVIH